MLILKSTTTVAFLMTFTTVKDLAVAIAIAMLLAQVFTAINTTKPLFAFCKERF